jgi:hypothetical protein
MLTSLGHLDKLSSIVAEINLNESWLDHRLPFVTLAVCRTDFVWLWKTWHRCTVTGLYDLYTMPKLYQNCAMVSRTCTKSAVLLVPITDAVNYGIKLVLSFHQCLELNFLSPSVAFKISIAFSDQLETKTRFCALSCNYFWEFPSV